MARNIGKIKTIRTIRAKDCTVDDFRCISYDTRDYTGSYTSNKAKTQLTRFEKKPYPVEDDTDVFLQCMFGSSTYSDYVDLLILRKPVDLTNIKTILIHSFPTSSGASGEYYHYYDAPAGLMACSLPEVANLDQMIPKYIVDNSIKFEDSARNLYPEILVYGRVFKTNVNIVGNKYLIFSFTSFAGKGRFKFSHIELF